MEKDYKSLFVQWLEEEAITATKKGSKLALLYNRALDQVRRYPDEITTLKTLKSIKYVGEKTATTLKRKLVKYCETEGEEISNTFDPVQTESEQPAKRKRTTTSTKKYIPKYRSGGYAILLALYQHDKSDRGIAKDPLINHASKHCDRSFTSNPSTSEFYSAWNSVKTLMNHNLVDCSGRTPKLYFLTDEGRELAQKLKLTGNGGVASSPNTSMTTNAEMSFDNGLRYMSSPIAKPQMSSPRVNPQHDAKNRTYNGIKYEIWQKEEYEIILYLDNREIRSMQDRDFFPNRLALLKTPCQVKALTVGDAVWIARHKQSNREVVLNYICERKRLDDLVRSLTDGRYHEQKSRLKKTGMKHFYYLIEDINATYQDVNGDSLQTAISSTMTTSKLYLRRFRDIEETIAFLASNTTVIKNVTSTLLVVKPQDLKNQQEYTDVLQSFREKFEPRYECVHQFQTFQDMLGKTNVMTVKEMFIVMLMTIRGVSLERAIVIQARFPTPKSLIEFYNNGGDKDSLMREMDGLGLVGNKKIGKVVSERVYEIWGSK
ncbi:Crossover junction endonuclease MUS81 [Spathaspora sp. JA1]|nr:Crossover junction endonuclease MUS81 [Spathaspora sp. JA1]